MRTEVNQFTNEQNTLAYLLPVYFTDTWAAASMSGKSAEKKSPSGVTVKAKASFIKIYFLHNKNK